MAARNHAFWVPVQMVEAHKSWCMFPKSIIVNPKPMVLAHIFGTNNHMCRISKDVLETVNHHSCFAIYVSEAPKHNSQLPMQAEFAEEGAGGAARKGAWEGGGDNSQRVLLKCIFHTRQTEMGLHLRTQILAGSLTIRSCAEIAFSQPNWNSSMVNTDI